MVIRCKTCGELFELSPRQVSNYITKYGSIPTHCTACRKERRRERKSPYYGIEEAFYNYMPCKKRHRRVYYSPYIMGGLR